MTSNAPLAPLERPPRSRVWLVIVLVVIGVAVIAVLLYFLLRSPAKLPVKPDAALAKPDAAPVKADAGSDARDSAAGDVGVDAEKKRRKRGYRRVFSREIRALLRRHRGMIKLCYRRATRRGLRLRRMRANVVVDLRDGGRIRSVRVNAGGERSLRACLRRTVRAFRFPRAAKQQFVRFPIVLAR